MRLRRSVEDIGSLLGTERGRGEERDERDSKQFEK